MSKIEALDSLSPAEPLEISNGLTLTPRRVKLNLTVHPALPSSSTKPIDDWKLKLALTDFLKTSLSLSAALPQDDLHIEKFKDIKKRKRDDAVARGCLCIRELGFLNGKKEEKDEVKDLERKFVEWRKYVVERMDGIELNLEGVKYKLSVDLPESDDFEGMKKSWEETFAFGNRGYSSRQEPDTIILRGVPSRWFAEPRVSSKPSMLVTHTIFSTFGKIRNLHVSEDDEQDKDAEEDGLDLVSGLNCKIVVQFEKHRDFYNALKVLCGRSLQKQGSRLKADYTVTWAKHGFFRNSRNEAQEKGSRKPTAVRRDYNYDGFRREPHNIEPVSDNARRKRFKE